MKCNLHCNYTVICIGNSTVSRGISKFAKISRAAAASDIWRVLKYYEPVFTRNTPKKPCYFLFIPQGKEISHLVTLFSHARVIGFTTTCDQTCDRRKVTHVQMIFASTAIQQYLNTCKYLLKCT